MKASFYTESILYWLVRGISFIAQRIPPRWNTAWGASVGTVIYHLLGSRRPVALANLRAAFEQTKSNAEYQKILKGSFQHLGMTLMEVARIPKVDKRYVERWIEVSPESRERLNKALSLGHGIIHPTAHFGNWEFIPITGSLTGYSTLALVREQGWPRLNKLLRQYRESKGCRVVSKGFPIREVIRGLRDGKVVGILADQDGGRNGVLAPFFGRLASTASGIIALSITTGAPILPLFIVRTGGPAHRLVVEDPLPIPQEGPMEVRVAQGIAAFLRVLERYVRQDPSQWLWLHRRWKSSPDRRVLLLTDGKAGHRAQLKAFAQRLKEAWELKTRDDKRLEGIDHREWMRVRTVEVSFRHPIRRAVLSAVASLVPKRFSGGEGWLRWGLTPASYEALRGIHADLSVSCGASTAAVHLLWAWQIRSKTVHITRCRFPSWRLFDLSVIPQHDLEEEAETVLGRKGTPSVLVTNGALAPSAQQDPDQERSWQLRLGLRKSVRIGLMLGGPARGVEVTLEQVEQLVQSLLAACDSLDAELIVTSSRRSPPELEQKLEQMLRGNPRCRLLALVNRNDSGALESTQEAAQCIFSLSDLCVVSGDSISMVSEALQREKPVVSFHPKRTRFLLRSPKYVRFLEQLKRQGKIAVADPAQVGAAVVAALNGVKGERFAPHTDSIVEYLTKWL